MKIPSVDTLAFLGKDSAIQESCPVDHRAVHAGTRTLLVTRRCHEESRDGSELVGQSTRNYSKRIHLGLSQRWNLLGQPRERPATSQSLDCSMGRGACGESQRSQRPHLCEVNDHEALADNVRLIDCGSSGSSSQRCLQWHVSLAVQALTPFLWPVGLIRQSRSQ